MSADAPLNTVIVAIALFTLHQKRTRVWFEFPEEIPLGYEIMMQMLLENAKIKIIYRGTLILVYIYTKN